MAPFNTGRKGAGRGSYRPGGGKGGFRGGPDRGGRPELFETKCADCGKDTMVPFRPTGDRPVYCRDCFSRRGGGEERGRQAGERGMKQNPSYAPREDRPREPRPDRQDAPRPAPVSNNEEVKKQLEAVNDKLERLIVAIESMKAPAVASAKPTAAVAASAKPKAAAKKKVSKK